MRLVESQLSVDTGCDGNWKDVIAIESPASGPAVPTPPAPPSDIHVCVYAVAGDTGQLGSGFWLTEREASALRTALDAAGPAVPCDKPHTRFAVLRSSSSGGEPNTRSLIGDGHRRPAGKVVRDLKAVARVQVPSGLRTLTSPFSIESGLVFCVWQRFVTCRDSGVSPAFGMSRQCVASECGSTG